VTTASTVERENGALQAIYDRRAVRSYAPTELADSTIRSLLEAAVQAPTAMHREPWAFVVVQDRALLKRYSDRAKAVLLEQEAKQPPAVSPSDTHLAKLLADPGFNIFYNAGTLIVICGKPLSAFATADCWLAAENLMLAAWSLHLGTCCIGFAVPVLNTPEAKRELGIPADVVAVAPIIVGVPGESTPPAPRRPPEILRWVRQQ
jgi:nitroreductase